MYLFDTHFHYSGDIAVDDYLNVINSDCRVALERLGVADMDVDIQLAAVGSDYAGSLRAAEFASLAPDCIFAAGVHPHQAEDFLKTQEDFSVFRKDPRFRAVGELGLDYYYEFSNREAQQQVFERFLDFALECDLPAVVHLRDRDGSDDAYRDALELLKAFAASGGVFSVHCYAGNCDFLKSFLELGAYIGVTGMVTFRAADNIRSNLELIPDERLLIETDSPYLAPVPFRGKTNSPGFLVLAAAEVARVRKISLTDVAEITTANARRFFQTERGV